ncbi:MAG: DNA polymerase III subunit beta [Acidobacteriota bacterium]|nr:MAG: DNA polymerase III subunit beta [Acidobacteriota bacterium]
MQLIIGKTPLLKELNMIQGVVEKKSTIPILSNLLIEAAGGELSIKATDLDVSITTGCEAEIRAEGSICIQARKLLEIVRALPEADVEIKSGDKDQVTILCERSKFKMPGVGTDNFPNLPEFSDTFTSLPADLVRTFINRTSFAITSAESRYILNGAKFEITPESIRMIATDGHRLSFIEKQAGFGDEKMEFLIPKKTLAELGRLCAETEEPVEFGSDSNHLFFKVGRRLLTSRTLSGQFPNYDQVMPKENNQHITIESDRVASAVRRVSLMADERSHAIKFEISEGKIHITSNAADVGEAGETLSVDFAGPEFNVGFNAQYLLDFFSVVQDNEVIFDFKDGASQVQMRPKNEVDYNFKYIVMPMRL